MALGLAVAASYSETGSRRLVLAMSGSNGAAQKEAEGIQASARSRDAASDIAPLAERVRVLAADRERLAARIGKIERHLDDLTGSIKAQTGTGAFPVGATRASPQATADPIGPPAPASAPQAAQPASSDPARQSVGPTTDDRSEALPGGAPAASERSSSVDASKVEFGVEIGGAANFEGLRQLWTSTKGSNAALFEGLHGVVALRENSKTRATELRLVVGPLADADAATRLCAALAAAHRYCQPAGFEGQRLADADKATERRPASRPVPRAPRLFGLFQ